MKVYKHPLGFLRVEFTRDETGADMLHIWDTPYEDDDIHQHTSYFTSTIIEGVMTENLFTYCEDPDGEYERLTAVCYADDEGVYHTNIAPGKIRVTPVLVKTITHYPGETYTRPKDDFHRVTVTEAPLITRRTTGQVVTLEHFILRKAGT